MSSRRSKFASFTAARQLVLFRPDPPRPRPPIAASDEAATPWQPRFVDQDPSGIQIGDRWLDQHLKQCGLGWVLKLDEFLATLDITSFAANYAYGAPEALHPRRMIALVLFGTMNGTESLRALETLARCDLRAIWLCGGLRPDHSTIGRFLHRHDKVLTEDFFEQLTARVLRAIGSDVSDLSGDGTVVQAATSRHRRLRQEAAHQQAQEAAKKAADAPDDEGLKKQAERAALAASEADARVEQRHNQRKDAESVRVSRTEPEAVLQRQKDKSFAFAYVLSVLANDKRVIVAHAVDPKSETAVVEAMLDQAERIGAQCTDAPTAATTEQPAETEPASEVPTAREATTAEKPPYQHVQCARFDGNYNEASVLNLAVARSLNLLLPPPSKPRSDPKTSKQLSKDEFRYDETNDVYVCPVGNLLRRKTRPADPTDDDSYSRFQASASDCKDCLRKKQCLAKRPAPTTKDEKKKKDSEPSPRTIKRYGIDNVKDAMRAVMQQPLARKEYGRRRVMVEPIFSETRGVQGLRRFRRRGLHNVRLEFALHASAHNLRRLIVCAGWRRRLLWSWPMRLSALGHARLRSSHCGSEDRAKNATRPNTAHA